MATIHFYEKPGCLNNTRQKQVLSKAGHLLVLHNLLQHPWSQQREKLRSFFGDMPVCDWFNRSAPAVKNGEIDPQSLNEDEAIELMVSNPILIRRPLMEVGGLRRCGFDAEELEKWLGLSASDDLKNLQSCPKQNEAQVCRP